MKCKFIFEVSNKVNKSKKPCQIFSNCSQIVLILDKNLDKFICIFQVVPYGSYSYIKNLTDEKTLPLYGSGGFRMIFDSKFDSAMVAFLDCLTQFANEVSHNLTLSQGIGQVDRILTCIRLIFSWLTSVNKLADENLHFQKHTN